MRREKGLSAWQVVLITLGVVAAVLAVVAVIYKLVKKYYKVNLGNDSCGMCDEDCFCDEIDFEPECCVYDGTCGCDDDAVEAE